MRRHVLLLAVLGVFLSGCNSSLDADLAADPLDNATRVVLPLDGIVLRTADGQDRRVTRGDSAEVDLLQFDGDTLYGLITNGDPKDGDYRGVQLIVDEDGFVERTGGARLEIDPAPNPPFAAVSFSMKEDDGDRIVLLLGLDLRLSLSETDDDRYQLRPVLRAMKSGDEAEINGSVANALLSDARCNSGAAVYAFLGDDVEPDERDGEGVEPFATAPVLRQGGTASYRLRLLPAGRYTLALTCDGEREDGLNSADPEMAFDATAEVELDEGESATLNLRT
jgi:hypothetical protein